MPVFNDIGKKLTQTGQEAVKRTKDMLEAGKLRSQVNAEKRKLAGLYQQIGKIYVEELAGEPDERVAGLCAESRESKRKIAEWEAEINALKGLAVCPKCGFMNALGANFCSSCGVPMPKKDEPAETAQ